MRPYLGPPWTNSCQIWCVRVFHHVLLKYGHEHAEMQKRKIWWRYTSVLYMFIVFCCRWDSSLSLWHSLLLSHDCGFLPDSHGAFHPTFSQITGRLTMCILMAYFFFFFKKQKKEKWERIKFFEILGQRFKEHVKLDQGLILLLVRRSRPVNFQGDHQTL